VTPANFYNMVILPASQRFGAMAFHVPNSQASRVLLMAIAGIETGWSERIQIPNGPARSYWQIESNGALLDVYANADTQQWLVDVCTLWDIDADAGTVFEAIAYHDPLAYVMARLTLWLDPAALPAVGDSIGAWDYYLRNWRPGKPRPDAWPAIYAQTMMVAK
jgi:hypothetical protein